MINTAFWAGSRTRQKPRPATALNLGSGQRVSGGGVGAEEAADSYHQFSHLMAVQSQGFKPASKTIIPDPRHVDPKLDRDQEWSRRKDEIRFWQSARKRQILDEGECLGISTSRV